MSSTRRHRLRTTRDRVGRLTAAAILQEPGGRPRRPARRADPEMSAGALRESIIGRPFPVQSQAGRRG